MVQGQMAQAQAVAENAVTESDDAFGRSVGSESTGIYSSREIRGFNPVDAGNARINSLYYDQVSPVSFRLTDGTTIRVGFATQGYSFPAPTGLVDYDLAHVGTDTTLSIDLNGHTDAFEPHVAGELRVPLDGDKLGIYAGYAFLDFHRGDGRNSTSHTYGTVARWKPHVGAEVSAFAWQSNPRDDEAQPTYFTDGTALPPELKRNRNLSLAWADNAKNTRQLGLLARLPVGGLLVEGGLFSDRTVELARFSDLLTGVAPDGSVADRVVIVDAGGRDHSLSGELRLVKRFETGPLQHRVTLSFRGRKRDRLFGGARRVSLGPSTIVTRDPLAEPIFTVGPKNSDRVRQTFYGVAYSGYFFERLIVDAGASYTDYSKRIDFDDPTLPDTQTTARPLLWNASAAFDLTKSLSVFAGMSRGMEEALIAPDRATNRSEAPPAIKTRQKEAGLRYALGDVATAVVSAFEISKPYYNLDPALRYRLLGTVVNRGVEASVVVRPAAGVTLLGGAVLSDPAITGEAVDNGLVGPRPIGKARARIVANLNWRLDGGQSPWSIDVAFERSSGRIANAANTLSLPSKAVLDLGMRYRFNVGPTKMLVRAKVENLFNDYSWDAAPSGGLTYIDPRRVELQFIADL